MGKHKAFSKLLFGPELSHPLDLLAAGYSDASGRSCKVLPLSFYTWMRVKVRNSTGVGAEGV